MKELSHLKSLRKFRGEDNAVKIIEDRNRVESVLADFSSLSRDDLTNSILSCYDGELYGNTMWTKKYEAWGNRPEIITVHGKFAEQYPHLSQLNLDMGFISYLPEFLEYAKTKNLKNKDIFSVRQNFKDYLGSTTLWRGILLTEEKLKSVQKEGILSSFFRTEGIESKIEQFEANILSIYPWQIKENQFNGGHCLSPLISVSADKNIALDVGNSYNKVCLQTGTPKEMYIFKLKIPLIDVIPYTDHCLTLPDLLTTRVEEEKETFAKNKKSVCHHLWKTNIEQFVLYKINVEEIKEVIKVDK